MLGGSSQLGYVVNNHGGRKSPKDRVIPIPNGLFMAYNLINGGSYLLTNWDDPPSRGFHVSCEPRQEPSRVLFMKYWLLNDGILILLHDNPHLNG